MRESLEDVGSRVPGPEMRSDLRNREARAGEARTAAVHVWRAGNQGADIEGCGRRHVPSVAKVHPLTEVATCSTETRIEEVAQGIAEHVEAEDRQRNANAGPDDRLHVNRRYALAEVQHLAPGRLVRVDDAEAEEAQCGLSKDHSAEPNRGLNHEWPEIGRAQ